MIQRTEKSDSYFCIKIRQEPLSSITNISERKPICINTSPKTPDDQINRNSVRRNVTIRKHQKEKQKGGNLVVDDDWS